MTFGLTPLMAIALKRVLNNKSLRLFCHSLPFSGRRLRLSFYAILLLKYEHFALRRLVQKELIRTYFTKIVNDEIIFVPSDRTKAQHTKWYVSISLLEVRCKKNPSEPYLHENRK